jgi:ankyrin repeat protein
VKGASIRTLVEQDPTALERRLSRFEEGLTPLHFALSRNRYDLLDLLIELGAGLDGKDSNGLTVLESAMLRGDKQAMASLQAAGAEQPLRATTSNFRSDISQFAASVQRCVPMLYVPDVAAALLWYQSIGFDEIARYSADGLVNFGIVAFGKAEIMLNMHGKSGVQSASLWLDTDRVDELYQLLKSRQIEAALAGETSTSQGIEFVEHLNDTFYGARQFGIKDLNGYTLYFIHNKVNT